MQRSPHGDYPRVLVFHLGVKECVGCNFTEDQKSTTMELGGITLINIVTSSNKAIIAA